MHKGARHVPGIGPAARRAPVRAPEIQPATGAGTRTSRIYGARHREALRLPFGPDGPGTSGAASRAVMNPRSWQTHNVHRRRTCRPAVYTSFWNPTGDPGLAVYVRSTQVAQERSVGGEVDPGEARPEPGRYDVTRGVLYRLDDHLVLGRIMVRKKSPTTAPAQSTSRSPPSATTRVHPRRARPTSVAASLSGSSATVTWSPPAYRWGHPHHELHGDRPAR